MKARLLFPDKDVDWRWAMNSVELAKVQRQGYGYVDRNFRREEGLPWNERFLSDDLSLDALIQAMADGDDLVAEVCRKVLCDAAEGDLETILFRQEALADCVANETTVRAIYALSREAHDLQKKDYLGWLSRYPEGALRDSARLIKEYLAYLEQLRVKAEQNADSFSSKAWTRLFATLREQLNAEYVHNLRSHLHSIKQQDKVLKLSAGLGEGLVGRDYVLHRTEAGTSAWLPSFLSGLMAKRGALAFELDPRDEAGIKSLTDLRERGIRIAANTVGKSAIHIRNFFDALSCEIAFYVGCLNLKAACERLGVPVCMPEPRSADEEAFSARQLRNLALALTEGRLPVGNDVQADGKSLILLTGLNSGGKTMLLGALGLAQLMMQAGMFVAAEKFRSSVCEGLFTHYKKEEDPNMKSGKLDEELSRMGEIVRRARRRSVVLMNESFASTNEREGSNIGVEVASGLADSGIRVWCVTHQVLFASEMLSRYGDRLLSLVAEKDSEGNRTYRFVESAPQTTSNGIDIFRRTFEVAP